MPKLLTIKVMNNTSYTQNFFFFQQPAVYSGGGQVYSNSLYSQSLGSYAETGAVLSFLVSMEFNACIQQAHTWPQIDQSSGYTSASRAIELALPGGNHTNDWTTASVSPLGLSAPTNGPGVQPGAFRITTPAFGPPAVYNVGSALAVDGGIVLSNFIMANPMTNIDCQPVLKYYVQTGTYTPGTVMDFTQSSVNAALADFTSGYTICNVTLQPDGTWSTQLM